MTLDKLLEISFLQELWGSQKLCNSSGQFLSLHAPLLFWDPNLHLCLIVTHLPDHCPHPFLHRCLISSSHSSSFSSTWAHFLTFFLFLTLTLLSWESSSLLYHFLLNEILHTLVLLLPRISNSFNVFLVL